MAGTPLYRIHRAPRSPWWFSSDGSGRFDLAAPHGTCYLAEDPLAALLEVTRGLTILSEAFLSERRLLSATRRQRRYHRTVSEAMVSDRRASWREVDARRAELRRRALACGLREPRLREDGSIIVHSPELGYRATGRFAAEAAAVVGTYVHVITDDVPAASGVSNPL